MVRLARQDLGRPEELLEQHHASELMRQRDRPERQERVRALHDVLGKPESVTHDETELLAGLPALLEEVGDLEAGKRLALPVEDARMRTVRDTPRDGIRLSNL